MHVHLLMTQEPDPIRREFQLQLAKRPENGNIFLDAGGSFGVHGFSIRMRNVGGGAVIIITAIVPIGNSERRGNSFRTPETQGIKPPNVATSLGGPFGGRMSRDVRVQNPPPLMASTRADVQNMEADRWHW
jgi:hypothetical protein